MGFKRLSPWLFGQGLLFLCGSGLVLALQDHLYACAVVLALLGAWSAASVIGGRPIQNLRPLSSKQSAARMEWRVLGSALDPIPAPLLLIESDGALKAANRAARTLFNTDDQLVNPPRPLLDALAASSAHDGRLTVTLDAQSQSRAYVLSVIDLAGVEGLRRIAMLVDIQPEIRAAEAAALRDLMQVLSHEIMNALTPVASLAATAVDLLADETPASATLARDAIETLGRRAQGLSRFVEAYRTLARLPPPTLKPTSVSALLDEAAKLARSRWAGDVTFAVTRPAPDIIANLDLDLMLHALMNILANATDAARAGGERAPTVALTARAREAGIAIAVTDSGAGVAPADRERVFQPFFTTKASGTGVGLSFARQVALSHGGDLSLAPQALGGGATFELIL